MSKEQERRRQVRLQRQRQRRQERARPQEFTPTATGQAPLPGAFGWIQRHGRLFYLVGILVMVLSLGAFFLGTNLSSSSSDIDDINDRAEAAADDTSADDTANDTAADPDDGDAADDPADAADDDEDPAIVRAYDAPPPMTIDAAAAYTAVLHTEKGDITIELLPQAAPVAVNNFVFLARNRFYEGLTFHRVVADFVAQAGDPTASGFGGSGYTLDQDENDLPLVAGAVAMAKGDATARTTDGAQFFIALTAQPGLDPNFTVFGRVVDGLEVARALTVRDPEDTAAPPGDLILSVDVTETAAAGG